jgi:hypothetical protein
MDKAAMIVRVAGYFGHTLKLSPKGLVVSPRPDPTSQIAGVIKANRDLLVEYLNMSSR